MKNWNGDLFCAVDVETTGLDNRIHDVVELAVVPLASDFSPHSKIAPFSVEIQPRRPENIDWEDTPSFMNTTRLMGYTKNGFSQVDAVDYFEQFVEGLQLPNGKRIIPLGHNYIFDQGFMRLLFGEEAYNHFFHYHYRDTMQLALCLNDMAVMRDQQIPFPKVSLQYMKSCFKIDNGPNAAHTAIMDALDTAKVFRHLMIHGPVS